MIRNMEWVSTKPKFSKTEVDGAGYFLFGPNSFADRNDPRTDHAYEIVSNWRSAHNYPLNSIQKDLRQRALSLDSTSFVAQRIKRISSIRAKIERFPTMRFSMMQDIGGCRAVTKDVKHVRALVELRKQSRSEHELTKEDDYITSPKPSGYRGVHLVYRFVGTSRKSKDFSGLKIEIQIRSALQHAWATAVETVGTFTQQALKSSQGSEEWLRFFALSSSAIALREGTSVVPGTPLHDRKLRSELAEYAVKLDVKNQLQTFGSALREDFTPHVRDTLYLLELDPTEKRIRINSYRKQEFNRATDDYLAIERKMRPGNNAVLVSSDSIKALRRAYPNYFLDTAAFIKALEIAIQK